MSFIYCITNDINGKQYVGKTDFTIEKRFKEHCSDSKRGRCEKRPLYDAMNKYGIEHFHIEQLEECSYDESEDREIYWIDKLDTFHNGYNATLGGDAKHYLDYDKILDVLDNTTLSLKEMAQECNCSKDSIKNIAKAYNKKINWKSRAELLQKKPVVMIDKYSDRVIKTFSSINEAFRYMKQNYEIVGNSSSGIASCCNGRHKTMYGYKWKFAHGDDN